MGENIELQNLSNNRRKGSDSEEYDKISYRSLQESMNFSKHAYKTGKNEDYDFFTFYDTGIIQKTCSKNTKTKKRNIEKNMTLDFINSKLTNNQFVIENKIVTIDQMDQEKSFSEKQFGYKPYKRHLQHLSLDPEQGLNIFGKDKIRTIFPTIYEANYSDSSISVQYTDPILFRNVVSQYLESDLKQGPKFLDLILNNIQFTNHHKFSLENLICVRLLEYYKEYEIIKTKLKDISRKVDVNRMTRNNLKEQLLKINPNKKEHIRFDRNILKYTAAFLDCKERYHCILKNQKYIIHKILLLWADIVLVREKTGATKTDYFLQVINTETNLSEFKKQWNTVFEIEYSDLLLKMEYDFVKKYLQYKEFKRNTIENNYLGGPKITKPKLVIDHDKIKVMVESIVDSIVLRNNIDLVLTRDQNILNNARVNLPANEYCFKIFVDDVFVCESDHYLHTENTNLLEFTDYLSVKILSHNKAISIVLFENNVEMSTFTMPLSSIRKHVVETSVFKHDFVFNNNIEPTLKHIGSGYDIKAIAAANKVRLKSSNMFEGRLFTNCEVNIQLGWNEKLNSNQLETIQSCTNIGQQLKKLLHGKIKPSVSLLAEIINNLYDKNVQDDQSVMETLNHICKFNILKDANFDIMETNVQLNRFKLLHLRSKGRFSKLDVKNVPLFINQVSTELWNYIQKSEGRESYYLNFQKNAEMHSIIDLQRFIGEKFVEKLNQNLRSSANDLVLKITYKDLVNDFEDLTLRSLFSNKINLSLNAASCITKQHFMKECLTKEQKIYISVLRAFNLLDRSVSGISENEEETIAGFKIHPLRPIVRVSYHKETVQTTTSIGQHPTWNNTLKIKTRLEPLSTIHVNVYDQVRDVAGKAHSDDRLSGSPVNYRRHFRWLGSVKIPLHAVLNLGSVRGTFKLNIPPLLFGYENSVSKEPQSIFPEVNQLIKKDTALIALQISTSVSHLGGLKTYRQPEPNSSENDLIIRQVNDFVTDYLNEFPTRNISLSAIDSTGRNKCVSEFLQRIPLPNYEYFPKDPKKIESAISKSSGFSKSSSSKSSRTRQSMTEDRESVRSGVETWRSEESQLLRHVEAAVRYVSLIPAYEATDAHVVTLTGVELLKVLYGSHLDHTILLASYFLHLGIKCWVTVGFALPSGLSSYVLVQHFHNKVVLADDQFKTRGLCGGAEGFSWYIYDAVAGERYELREIGCPLKTVSYVFDNENIWVNIQPSQDCGNVYFDFSKSSDWRSVFSKPIFFTRAIVGDDLYSKPVPVEDFRLNLETKIKNKFQKWRSHVKTIWNRYCSTLLRDMLPYWEHWSFNQSGWRPAPGHRLKQLMGTYKIFGFPLNIPYLNSKLIISAVKSTALHINEDPNVEFATAVEVYAYPNNVVSVWVFIASITRL